MEARMIDALLSEKAEERRSLFEEAAGIGIYRDRKRSTERRLEETAADLARLEDLIAEVQTQVRSLARQRGRAERYSKMIEERFGIAITLVRRELEDLDLALGALGVKSAALARAVPAARERLAEAERDRDARGQGRQHAEDRRSAVVRRLADATLEVDRVQAAGERAARESGAQVTAAQARALAERAASEARNAAQAAQALERARRRVAELKEQEAHGRSVRRRTEEALAQLTARRDALAELARERVGLAPAAQALLQAKARFGDAVVGQLADFVGSSLRRAELESLEQDVGDAGASETRAVEELERTLTELTAAEAAFLAAATEAERARHAELEAGSQQGDAERGAAHAQREAAEAAAQVERLSRRLAGVEERLGGLHPEPQRYELERLPPGARPARRRSGWAAPKPSSSAPRAGGTGPARRGRRWVRRSTPSSSGARGSRAGGGRWPGASRSSGASRSIGCSPRLPRFRATSHGCDRRTSGSRRRSRRWAP